MKNKTILITGASAGLGRELAICLAKSFAQEIDLVLVARNKPRLLAVEKKVRSYRTPSLVIAADVARASDWQRVFKLSIKKFKKMDMLLLNAGVSMWSPLAEITPQHLPSLKKIMEVNYLGLVYPLYYFLPELRRAQGRVLVISSLQGYLALPFHSGYAASKHAVHGFIEALALEEKKVSFHKVILGWVRNTNMRKNRLLGPTSKGEKKNGATTKNAWLSVSAAAGAETIVKALQEKRENIFIPTVLKWALFLKLFFPQTLSKIIQKVVKIEFGKK